MPHKIHICNYALIVLSFKKNFTIFAYVNETIRYFPFIFFNYNYIFCKAWLKILSLFCIFLKKRYVIPIYTYRKVGVKFFLSFICMLLSLFPYFTVREFFTPPFFLK